MVRRRYGIIEVDERSVPLEEWREAPFEDHFPSADWLKEQLAAERQRAGGVLLRPHTDWGWYVDRMIANLGLMNSARAKGETDEACLYAVELGLLIAESKIKFEWEADALRGRKLVEGAASTRIATDEDRRTLIEQIMHERGKGARDAFRVAAQRRPEWGRWHSFKASFYKKVSKPGD